MIKRNTVAVIKVPIAIENFDNILNIYFNSLKN